MKEVCHKTNINTMFTESLTIFFMIDIDNYRDTIYEYLDALKYQNDILDLFHTVLLVFFNPEFKSSS